MSRHPMSASADYENKLSAVQASGASRRELDAARATIAELQKRIGELEADRDCQRTMANVNYRKWDAERQRREDGGAEIVRLRGIIDRVSDTSWEKAGLATNFVSMHENDPDRDWQAMLELMRYYRAEMERLQRPPSSTEAENE